MSEYSKARRSYVLFAGLLLAWELIGIEIEENLSNHLNLTIKSPQAAPFVIIALVLYFAIRFSCEWLQMDDELKLRRWALFDFIFAHLIALFALNVWVIQMLLIERQIVEVISPFTLACASFVVYAGFLFSISPSFALDRINERIYADDGQDIFTYWIRIVVNLLIISKIGKILMAVVISFIFVVLILNDINKEKQGWWPFPIEIQRDWLISGEFLAVLLVNVSLVVTGVVTGALWRRAARIIYATRASRR